MLFVYGLILVHDFIPHHEHLGEYFVHTHDHCDGEHSHSDCEGDHECDFPFHQHSINEAGLFMSPSMLVVNVPILIQIDLEEFILVEQLNNDLSDHYSQYQALKHCEPEISSSSLRGPPLA